MSNENEQWTEDEQFVYGLDGDDLQDNLIASLSEIRGLKNTVDLLDKQVKELRVMLDELLDWVSGNRRISDDRLAEIESALNAAGEKKG